MLACLSSVVLLDLKWDDYLATAQQKERQQLFAEFKVRMFEGH